MDKIEVHYDQVADRYDIQYDHDIGREYYSHISTHILRNIPNEGRLLDLGCGTGLFMKRFIEAGGKQAVGLDLSQGMIKRAASRCPGNPVVHGNAEVLPFKDATFDAVSSLLAFSYLKSPESMLEESARVLKKGGVLAICTLGKNAFTKMVPAAYRLGEAIGIQRPGMAVFGEHYYGEKEITELFSSAGFTDVRCNRCSFAHVDLHPRLFSLSRKVEPFIEENMPYLAYNISVSGKKED